MIEEEIKKFEENRKELELLRNKNIRNMKIAVFLMVIAVFLMVIATILSGVLLLMKLGVL